MSLKTVVQSISSWATNFISKILPDSKKLIDIASYIVNGFKTIDAAHPEILNTLVALIPGTVDDLILADVRAALPKVLVDLKIVQDEVNKTPDQIVADGVAIVNSSPVKSVLLGSIWTALSNELTKDGVSITDLQKLQQTFYEEIGKNLIV
ncbi:hypothetical protein [Mucilaginibacter sp.]|uniref:hypothetical protein n=1 Tax=Mucilaginibacter sp. TaxID=1882438 RepID=UPI002612FA90|nr:hypothetical protein [Mucilaginibacter sp.]MDB5032246.1 hypothetical protein [Mucilaginibacter sp.]